MRKLDVAGLLEANVLTPRRVELRGKARGVLTDMKVPLKLQQLSEQHRLILDAVLLGVVGAIGAQAFMALLRLAQRIFLQGMAGYTPLGLVNEGGSPREILGPHGLWLIPVATTLGGLVTGILVYSLAPEAEGHGTDAAVKSFHQAGGFIRARVPFLKMIASAITLGAGGAGGREGPTALISAGVGSIYGTLARRPDKERRLLLLMGQAAGLAAIFRSPIGTAIFAIEVLYGRMEFETGALLYTMLASVVAYAINGLFVGWEPLFRLPAPITPPSSMAYVWYGILGLAAGLVATVLPMVFYGARDMFRALPLPPHVKPAIGGLAVGLIALKLPQVLGGGYGWLQAAIDGRLSAEMLLLLSFGMMLALAMTISSGGSGGVFAPSLFVGGMLGGFFGDLFHQPVAAFVVVGMTAVFAGAARVPVAAMLMVTEMTGGYNLLAPAALTVMLSYFIQQNLSSSLKYKSLYEAQVPLRSDSPAHQGEQLEAVLRLLSERRLSVPATVTHLSLRTLLESGIPVDLPDERQMTLVTLEQDSSAVGKTIQSCISLDHQDDLQIAAIFRSGHTLAPHPDFELQAGDRLLAIATPKGRGRLEQEITARPAS